MEASAIVFVLLAGPMVTSAIVMALKSSRPRKPVSVYDAVTDARYDRIVTQ